jgi:cell division protein FtsZ
MRTDVGGRLWNQTQPIVGGEEAMKNYAEVSLEQPVGAQLKVVGVGGGGGNAVNSAVTSNLQGVQLYALNTDMQALAANLAPHKVPLGQQITRGLGAGGMPEVGRRAAEEDIERIRDALRGADMVFVTAGMGGGTGTGAAPVVARVAKELGALTVAVVTKPFAFEATTRMRQAEEGIRLLKEEVDTLLVIPNQRLLAALPPGTSLVEAFRKCDEVLVQAVRAIADLITVQGLINLDFADVRTIMSGAGLALMGWGEASGEERAIQAAQQAVANPLLEDVSIRGASRMLVNITMSPDVSLPEIDTAVNFILEQAHPEVNLIFGVVLDESLQDCCRITVVATGFVEVAERAHAEPATEPRATLPLGTFANPPRGETEAPLPLAGSANASPNATRREREMPSSKRKVFLGTIDDAAPEPKLVPPAQATNETAVKAPRDAEGKYLLDPVEDEFDLPAFLRRQAG